jgi:hypothetical protein
MKNHSNLSKKTIRGKKNKTIRLLNKKMKKGGDIALNVFASDRMSTQPNNDNSYKEIGVLHVSDSEAINVARGFATGVSNFFGAKGFDNSLIDGLRNKTLTKVQEILKESGDRKVCNLRMEIDTSNPTLVFHHVYGTLLQRGSNVEPKEIPLPPPPNP